MRVVACALVLVLSSCATGELPTCHEYCGYHYDMLCKGMIADQTSCEPPKTPTDQTLVETYHKAGQVKAEKRQNAQALGWVLGILGGLALVAATAK